MIRVVIFAPDPLLTVTAEETADGPDVHIHAGGQGYWQGRMLRELGCEVVFCCVLTGEIGVALRPLLDGEGFTVNAVQRQGRGGVFIHQRQEGERHAIVETAGEGLSRHDADTLYTLTLGSAMDADLAILSGPAGDSVIDPDVYRRLASDIRAVGVPVVVDLAGERLESSLAGGVDVVKVSDEELIADGRVSATDPEQLTEAAIVEAMGTLRAAGARIVIVTRHPEPFLALADDALYRIHAPEMEVVDPRGAGDSLTAAVAAALAGGESLERALALGAASGALNVTRHGLGSGDRETIERLREHVTIETEIRSAEGNS